MSEGAGIPGLVHGAETIDRVRELESALSEPMNHLVTPPPKREAKPLTWPSDVEAGR